MNKLSPPSHIIGPMVSEAPDELKRERASWIVARLEDGFSSREIGAALQISGARVLQASSGCREPGKLNRRSADISLDRATWEKADPDPRHETDPRFTLVKPVSRPEPDLISRTIETIREIHAKIMAERTA
ncbi:hypothetical protein [Paracoccus sp. (in: a-proteobacteria)]|uniref:hypothetical protein n=1 Tax=Paracoccus sp. TaxID=267 RepID=UPI0028A04DD4|nr:hypothetical protein [Paracoccus sp. (in: a-proteobacteria)]